MRQFNANKYLDDLPVGGAKPDAFERELETVLSNPAMKHALGHLEALSLLAEKDFIFIDLTKPDGLAQAAKLQGKIIGIKLALATLVDLAIDKSTESDEPTRGEI